MQRMAESDIYNRLTKDGDSLPAIRKNTEMLRQEFTIEAQRVTHTLSQLDPHNKDRHEAEAQRIYQENNAALDRVLMQVASTTPQKMPLPIETINRVSEKTQIPKNQAKALLSLPLILFCAFPAALFWGVVFVFVVGVVVLVGAFIGHFVFDVQVSGVVRGMISLLESDKYLGAKILYGIFYFIAVILGFSHVRGGGTIGEVFLTLFVEPVTNLLSMLGGGGKR